MSCCAMRSRVSKSTAVSGSHNPSGLRPKRYSKSFIPQIIWSSCRGCWPAAGSCDCRLGPKHFHDRRTSPGFAGQLLELPHRRRWHTSASRAGQSVRSRSLCWHNCSPVRRFFLPYPRFSTRHLHHSIQLKSAHSNRGKETQNPGSQLLPAMDFSLGG